MQESVWFIIVNNICFEIHTNWWNLRDIVKTDCQGFIDTLMSQFSSSKLISVILMLTQCCVSPKDYCENNCGYHAILQKNNSYSKMSIMINFLLSTML